MQKFQITIPKPCHEDWGTMTPQERGRFCDKCCKTVQDFSSRTPEEIKLYIREHEAEKICGRFRNDQLQKPVRLEIPYQSIGTGLNASQVFLLALFFVFGTTLFSCKTDKDQTVGELALIETGIPPIENADSDSAVTVGDIICEIPGISALNENSTGKVAISEIDRNLWEDDTLDVQLPTVDIISTNVDLISFTVGAIVSTRIQIDCYQDRDSSNAGIDENMETQPEENFLVYPNPANESVHLKFELPYEQLVTADLFDINGQLIRQFIPSQGMPLGLNDIQFDISELPPANYLVRLMVGEKVETKRIVIL